MPAAAKPAAQSILDELKPLGSDAYRQIPSATAPRIPSMA